MVNPLSSCCSKNTKPLPIENLFKLPSPIPTWQPGGVFGRGTIDLGGLQVRQVSTFTKEMRCKGVAAWAWSTRPQRVEWYWTPGGARGDPPLPNFTISSPPHQYLDAAVTRYLHGVLNEHHRPLVPPAANLTSSSPLQTLTLAVADLIAPLHHGVNESYSLSIPAAGAYASIAAATPWGAMRGLETFSQFVWGDPARVASGIFIEDFPIFEHRGVMLDTSRNFYAVDDILRTIRAMSENKLNVFHWHITDSHSFPLVVESEPDLSGKGSYGAGMEYSPENVKTVVEFGLEHGVRVLPEIDMPGHTGSWAGAYPEIVTCANMFWWPAGSEWGDRLASEPGTGHLNPLNPRLTNQLLEVFVNSTFPYLVSLNRTVVYWEDVLLDAEIKVNPSVLPPENTILQTWNNGPNNTKKIVSSGYRAIVSSSDYYYLDCGHGDFIGNDSTYDLPPGTDQGKGGSWCGPFKTWQTIYNYDITYGLTDEEAKLVLGGEVALWSEQADSTVLDPRIWPRASAMAETLWSGNRDETGMKRYAEATDRLNEWRHRMVARGIGAEPIQPLWCIRNPGMCNTVHPF
ncbi:beta-hexosaminidase 2 [Actinidia rufa]|uniref:Beta-hexosaminidase n=1 Tax=Actinidia rufa TaxID=165716 RepID=A0A7J0FVK3_9ERIC|nr:beta-hexosaminidase 2 [Actinidia rufa]